MKYLLPLSVFMLLIVTACGGSGEKKIISVEKKVVFKEPVKVAVNRELSVDVSGMSCEQSCGGSIRMALKETGAVDRCSFDFKEGRKANKAFITFDKNKITADKILGIIRTINEGQFTTANATTKSLEAEASTSEETSEGPTETSEVPASVQKIGVSTTSFEFPNLFELLSELIS
jgi:copper chaperone CopZ